MSNPENPGTPNRGEILLYESEDGTTRLEIELVGGNMWLSLNQIAALFSRDKSVISRHLKNVFEERELDPGAVVANYATTASDGKIYQVAHYSLEAVLAVGYRIKSPRGTQFRIWATAVLQEYAIKGFALDGVRLKQAGGGNYFEELLARIRDIRSSEKVFWKKVLGIYATSIDYDPKADASQDFFATLQNKMHWAIHGHTAAEVVYGRSDAEQPNMGLTNWPGTRMRKCDIAIAKNYLNQQEREGLNRIVTAYLEFAELQALNRRPMTMRDWIAKLDDFLRLSDREILTHAGRISHEAACAKAELEYQRFRAKQLTADSTSRAEKDFEQAIQEVKKLPSPPARKKAKGDKP